MLLCKGFPESRALAGKHRSQISPAVIKLRCSEWDWEQTAAFPEAEHNQKPSKSGETEAHFYRQTGPGCLPELTWMVREQSWASAGTKLVIPNWEGKELLQEGTRLQHSQVKFSFRSRACPPCVWGGLGLTELLQGKPPAPDCSRIHDSNSQHNFPEAQDSCSSPSLFFQQFPPPFSCSGNPSDTFLSEGKLFQHQGGTNIGV